MHFFQVDPYGMMKDSSSQLLGNERYEGFGIDVIHELSLMFGFNYEFQIYKDYGSIDPVTKEWTGMIGAIRRDVGFLQSVTRE